ncbi:MAG: 2OG-Fe(II) oxygenase, partial [Pseudomonadota bacterium]|nr:2OG-Fe(II) oxygenase [Pseudomonadota bacterium]
MPHSTAAAQVSAGHRPTLDGIDWAAIEDALNDVGSAVLPSLLDEDACNALTALYPQDRLFRSRVVMERHGFGCGEYQYFAYPLPDLIAQLRTSLYPPLATIANRWNQAMD